MVRRGIALGPVHDQPSLRPFAGVPIQIAQGEHRLPGDPGVALGVVCGAPGHRVPLFRANGFAQCRQRGGGGLALGDTPIFFGEARRDRFGPRE